MDPFAVSMAVTPLVLSSVKLAMLVRTLKESYKNAPITLVGTTAECDRFGQETGFAERLTRSM